MAQLKFPSFFGVEEGKNSAIRLGQYVVADGLDRKKESLVRIQSHTHTDHLSNWKHHIKPDRKFVLSEASKEILMLEERHIKRRANIFTPKKKLDFKHNKYFDDIVNNESVSLCLRQNRFDEKFRSITNLDRNKSKIFLDEQVSFVYNAIEYFKKKLKSPSFYLWSNNFENLKDVFKNYNVKFVDNSNILDEVEKMHLDLFLMTKCKHYAVIPSAFNWWGTWLAKNNDKIVVRPRSNYFRFLNVKNKDYWPEDWISL